MVTNLLAGLEQAVEAIPGKWKNVMAVSLKTSRSVALPIYQRLPQYLVNKPKAALPGDPLLMAELAKVEEKGEGKTSSTKAEAKAKVAVGEGRKGGAEKKRPREQEAKAKAAAAPAAKKQAKGSGKGKGGVKA